MINFNLKNQNNHSLLPICEADVSQYYNKELRLECEADAQLFSSDVYGKMYMSEKITSRCPQYGRSMIEMLGVLAIIGVLSVGGIAGYSKAMHKYRINKTIEQITLIASNVRAFFAPQRNYEGVACYCDSGSCMGQADNDGCPVIKKAKIIPDEMITLNASGAKIDEIINEFGYGVALDVTNKSTSGDNQAFYIEYSIGINNEEACIELLSQDWTTADVKAIYLTDHDMIDFGFKTPVSIDKAVEKCSGAFTALKEAGCAGNVPFLKFYLDIDLSGTEWKNNTWQN